MATKKSGGSSKNGRDSNSKSLGIKVSSLSYLQDRNIIYLGNKHSFYSGKGTVKNKNGSIICKNKSGGVLKSIYLKKLNKKFFLII